jgi:hypothetical protein
LRISDFGLRIGHGWAVDVLGAITLSQRKQLVSMHAATSRDGGILDARRWRWAKVGRPKFTGFCRVVLATRMVSRWGEFTPVPFRAGKGDWCINRTEQFHTALMLGNGGESTNACTTNRIMDLSLFPARTRRRSPKKGTGSLFGSSNNVFVEIDSFTSATSSTMSARIMNQPPFSLIHEHELVGQQQGLSVLVPS